MIFIYKIPCICIYYVLFIGSCNVKTKNFKCCVFTFLYNNKLYYNCTTIDNGNTPWCATTNKFDKDNWKWGNCNEGKTSFYCSQIEENNAMRI